MTVGVADGGRTTCEYEYGGFGWYSNLVWQCVLELGGSPLAGTRIYPPLLTTNGHTLRATRAPGT